MKDVITEHAAGTMQEAIAAKAPYVGASITVIGGLSLNEWLAVVGIIFTVFTFFLNWWMQERRLKLLKASREKDGAGKPCQDTDE